MKRVLMFFGIAALLAGIVLGVLQWNNSTSRSILSIPRREASQETSLPPTPTPVPHRPAFATGVIFPQWGTTAYSKQDANWQKGLQEIKQLHARWVTMTLPLHMTGPQATQVQTRADTPTSQALQEGIMQAHQLGFHVFVTPLVTLDGSQSWAGYISFYSAWQAQAWFASYWQVLQPYVRVLAQEHVEMFSIGSEYDRLEDESPAQWKQLIQEIRAVFSGKLIYGINWSSFTRPLPSWLGNLDTVGCSTYFSVTTTLQRLTEHQAIDLWKSNVQSQLDLNAQRVGKPIVITEIGYRSGSTAGYLPYIGERQEPRDDQEQAILYNAAMQNLSTDQNISGIFWWAWSTPPFAPSENATAQVLTRWFLYL
jgi:hypothetical protein